MDEYRERLKTMKTQNKTNRCRQIRQWLYDAIKSRLGIESDWAQNHIANCPRCQQRLASLGKVNLALSVIKTQPQNLDLLSRANTQAIGVLKNNLRNTPKAEILKAALPKSTLLCRYKRYASPVAHMAACITILLLAKAGIFASMDKFQTKGRETVKLYYSSQAGQDIADEIFTS
jgi:hypothetical protein